MPVPLGCHTLSVWRSATVYSDESKVQHNTTLLSLCREICLLAHHLHKTVNIFNNKTSTTQIQGKFLTIAMYTRTHGGMHAPTSPPPPPHTHRVSLTHTHSHTHTHTYKQNNNRPFHKSTNWTQKSIQIGKTDTADYGDSKLIKLFSFNYKGMIFVNQLGIVVHHSPEGKLGMSDVSLLSGISGLSFWDLLSCFYCLVLLLFLFCHFLSSVEVTGHRHSAVTVP